MLCNKGHREEEMKTYEIEGQEEDERKLYISNDSSSNPFTPCGS